MLKIQNLRRIGSILVILNIILSISSWKYVFEGSRQVGLHDDE